MNKTIAFITILALLTACHSKKNAVVIAEEKPVVEKYKFENITPSDSLFTSISKQACFGQCPIYTIDIYNNGTVILNGKNFLDKIGLYKKQITYPEMLLFATTAKSINYMQLDDSYDNKLVSDVPTTVTSIVLNKKRKSIYDRYGAPKELKKYELLFTQLLKTKGWIKIKEDSNF